MLKVGVQPTKAKSFRVYNKEEKAVLIETLEVESLYEIEVYQVKFIVEK